MDNYKIKPVHGHFVLYINGEFYCTADTYHEAYEEYLAYEKDRVQREDS